MTAKKLIPYKPNYKLREYNSSILKMNQNKNAVGLKIHFQEPHFRLEDLNINDFKTEQYDSSNRFNIEPERLTQIYQQAFIYDLLFKFAKEYLPDIDEVKKRPAPNNCDASSLEKNQSTDTTIDKIKEKVLEYLFNDKNKASKEFEGQNGLDLIETVSSSDNIWNTDDLNILRKNFDGIKENNIRLRSQVAAYEEENKKLKEKLANIELKSDNSHNEKLALEQENERLYIRIQDLESRYRMFYDEMTENDREKQSAFEKISALQSENHNLKACQSKMEFETNKLEQKFGALRTEQRLYFNSLMDGMKLKYQNIIRELQEKLVESENRLNDKRLDAEKTKKALEHLRTHFMFSASNFETEDKIDDSLIK